MTNYVTGFMPEVQPKDWMKIAVGGVVGAIKLSDLKSYVGEANNGNTGGVTEVKLQDVNLPSGTVIYKDAPTPQSFNLIFSPLGANEAVTVTDVSTNQALNDISYDSAKRAVTVTGQYADRSATIRVSWSGGSKDFTIPVQLYNSGNGGSGGGSTDKYAISPENPTYTPEQLAQAQYFNFTVGGSSPSDIYTWTVEGIDNSLITTSTGDNGGKFMLQLKDSSTVTQSTTLNLLVKDASGNTVKQTTVNIVPEQKVNWTFSPATVSTTTSDFANTGVTSYARADGSGYSDLKFTSVDGYNLSDFEISTIGSNGQFTIVVLKAGTIKGTGDIVFHATGGSTSNTFTVTITG